MSISLTDFGRMWCFKPYLRGLPGNCERINRAHRGAIPEELLEDLLPGPLHSVRGSADRLDQRRTIEETMRFGLLVRQPADSAHSGVFAALRPLHEVRHSTSESRSFLLATTVNR